jgi:hypothetical protein
LIVSEETEVVAAEEPVPKPNRENGSGAESVTGMRGRAKRIDVQAEAIMVRDLKWRAYAN